MSQTIHCPQCRTTIELTEAISAELSASIRERYESEFAEKAQRLAADRGELAKLRESLQSQQKQLDEQVRREIEKQRESLVERARVEAQQAVAVEIKDSQAQLKETREKLQAQQAKELDLLKKSRELEEQAERQELEIARRIEDERKRVREAALKQAQQEFELRQAENSETINGLRKQVDQLKQKLEQGSQQTQGEVLELALENLLAEAFPRDAIEPVPKGVKGGDVVHRVFDQLGRECGAILWESKRTKNWSDGWLGKLIDDQQEARATCACIVSAALPEGVEHFGEVNGVWVSSWACARAAAAAMRRVLIDAAQARRATEGQQGKMELVYDYLAGPEFRNRVRGLVEPYIEMQADLEAEKRAYNKHWNKRQKQLDRALASTTGLYGDLQGIIGTGLQEIEGMEVLAIDAEKGTKPKVESAV